MDAESTRETPARFVILRDPPGPGWRLGARNAIHLDGGDWPDLGFLRREKDRLKHLLVFAGTVDLTALNELSELETLDLAAASYSVDALVLGAMPKLRSLRIWGGVPTEFTAGHPLRSLEIESMPRGWRGVFAGLPRLEALSLAKPRSVPEFYPSSLRSLELASVTHWDRDVNILRGLAELQVLDLVGVRGMRDLRAFVEVAQLERLYAEDCDELVALDGPTLAPNAQYLFVGRTPLRTSMPSRWDEPR